jgi:DNA repair protein RadC
MTKQMRDIEEFDRPREKIMRLGASALRDEELVAAIIGKGTRGNDVFSIATEVVALLRAEIPTFRELTMIRGVGQGKAAVLLACFELARRFGKSEETSPLCITCSEDILKVHEINSLRHERQEHFFVITLNGAHEVIHSHLISKGTINQSLVHPREVFAEAIAQRAAAIICVHNHPSGNLTPSKEDTEITRRLEEAGMLLGIPLLDHIIISKNGFQSLYSHSSV